MSTDAICTCGHGLGVLRHADDCPVAIERRQPVRSAALSAPSEPVPDGPRVWATPVIPDDVQAVSDRDGKIWRRQEDEERWWERVDAPRIMPESQLIDRCGPLTEVVEEATP